MLEHNDNFKILNVYGTQINQTCNAAITDDDINGIINLLKELGMRFNYVKPRDGLLSDMLFVDVYYKKPHIFMDTHGNKYCIGYYKRGMKESELSDKICTIDISKNYQREIEDVKNDPYTGWNIHYCFDTRLYGSAWMFGKKQHISGYTPAGLQMVYEYAENISEIMPKIRKYMNTMKDYIDGGKPAWNK